MIAKVIAARQAGLPRAPRLRLAAWGLWIAVAALLFSPVLAGLVGHALANPLHSHIPLVPLIAGYLMYTQSPRSTLVVGSATAPAAALLGCVSALAIAAVGIAAADRLSVNDYLAVMTLAFVALVWAGAFLVLGARWVRSAAFPLAFLLFMIPMPDGLVRVVELSSVRASTDAAAVIFAATGTPVLRDGTLLALPGIVLEVGRECSGIRSSWVLFITSVAASHLLLAKSWYRLAVVAFVIPLAIVRNAVRIVTIGLLAVYVGPHMVDSPIHRQGGPVFFAASLVPLLALVWSLRRHERLRQSRS
jgi:exosortase